MKNQRSVSAMLAFRAADGFQLRSAWSLRPSCTPGSPIAYTNQNKTVVEKNEFEPYGLEINGVTKDGPNYTGHVADTATGML